MCEGCSCVSLTFISLLVVGFLIFFHHAYVGYGHMSIVFLFFCFSLGFSLLFSCMYVGYHYILRSFSSSFLVFSLL